MCNKAKAIEILSNEKADAAYDLAEKHAIAKDQDWAQIVIFHRAVTVFE